MIVIMLWLRNATRLTAAMLGAAGLSLVPAPSLAAQAAPRAAASRSAASRSTAPNAPRLFRASSSTPKLLAPSALTKL